MKRLITIKEDKTLNTLKELKSIIDINGNILINSFMRQRQCNYKIIGVLKHAHILVNYGGNGMYQDWAWIGEDPCINMVKQALTDLSDMFRIYNHKYKTK